MFSAPVKTQRTTMQVGHAVPFGVPIKGLNVRDPLSLMDPLFGVNLVNVLAEPYGLRTRKGFTEWAIDLEASTGEVGSIMIYYPASAAPAELSLARSRKRLGMRNTFYNRRIAITPHTFGGKIFAARENSLYDVSTSGSGPYTAIAGLGTVNGAYWNSIIFQNIAGAFLCACNEGGGYFVYNGTTWTHASMGGGPNQIAGVDPDLFVYVMEWKKRLWFIQEDSTKAWYLPVEQIEGTVNSFDFGPQFPHGGKLAMLANWTVDGGAGIDDQLVAISTQGDVLIYKGTDPSAAATFNMVGCWNVGPLPAGRRTVTRRGGDVYILSRLGLIPLSKLLRAGADDVSTPSKMSVSTTIDPLLSTIMEESAQEDGWQVIDIPKEEMVLVGVPSAAGLYGSDFLALKSASMGWSILRDTYYSCFANADSVTFAGTTDGRVVLAFNGTLDNVELANPLAGQPIRCQVIPAYQKMGTPVMQKQALLMRPTFLATLFPTIRVRMLYDYGIPTSTLAPALPSLTLSRWDEALWDIGRWHGLQTPLAKWIGVHGCGFAATPQLDYVCGGDTLLTSIDLWVADGGAL